MEDERVRELNPHLFSGLLFLYFIPENLWKINLWMTNISASDIHLKYMMYLIAHNKFIIALAVKRYEIMQNWQKPQILQPNIDKGARNCSKVVIFLYQSRVFRS